MRRVRIPRFCGIKAARPQSDTATIWYAEAEPVSAALRTHPAVTLPCQVFVNNFHDGNLQDTGVGCGEGASGAFLALRKLRKKK